MELEFQYSSTFLTSALARDPFCYDGIVSLEDVIRIQRKFPTLFDRVPSPSQLNEDEDKSRGNVDYSGEVGNYEAYQLRKLAVSKSFSPSKLLSQIGKECSNLQIKGKETGVYRNREDLVADIGNVPTNRRNLINRQRQYSKMESKRSSVILNQAQKGVGGGKESVKLNPQQLSKGNRKTTAIKTSPGATERRLVVRPRPSLVSTSTPVKMPSNPRKEYERGRSPYTEDLVKLFLSRKAAELQKSQQFGVSKLNRVTSKQNIQKRPQKVFIAPGFIRGMSDLPRVPPYRNKRGNSDRGGVPSSTSIKDMGKHVTWTGSGSTSKLEGNSNIPGRNEQPKVQESLSDSFSNRPKPSRNVIHLSKFENSKSSNIPKPPSQPTIRNLVPKSSYNYLLAARRATSSYVLKADLRRHGHSGESKTGLPIRQTRSNSNQQVEPDSPVSSIGSTVPRSTSQVMEKIAEELVYFEILKHLSQFKLDIARKKRDDTLKSTIEGVNRRSKSVFDFKAMTSELVNHIAPIAPTASLTKEKSGNHNDEEPTSDKKNSARDNCKNEDNGNNVSKSPSSASSIKPRSILSSRSLDKSDAINSRKVSGFNESTSQSLSSENKISLQSKPKPKHVRRITFSDEKKNVQEKERNDDSTLSGVSTFNDSIHHGNESFNSVNDSKSVGGHSYSNQYSEEGFISEMTNSNKSSKQEDSISVNGNGSGLNGTGSKSKSEAVPLPNKRHSNSDELKLETTGTGTGSSSHGNSAEPTATTASSCKSSESLKEDRHKGNDHESKKLVEVPSQYSDGFISEKITSKSNVTDEASQHSRPHDVQISDNKGEDTDIDGSEVSFNSEVASPSAQKSLSNE